MEHSRFSNATPTDKSKADPTTVDTNSSVKAAFDAESLGLDSEFGEAAGRAGVGLLKGMAMNSKLSLEQKMSMKALEALVNSLATELTREPTPETATAAAQTASTADVVAALNGG